MAKQALILFLLAFAALAQMPPRTIADLELLASVKNRASSISPTYLLSEDCEGVGTPSGWTVSGTVYWDFTTTPLVGSQSLFINSSAFEYTVTNIVVSEFWFYAMVCFTNIDQDASFLQFRGGGSTNVSQLRLLTNEALRMYHANTNVTTSAGAISANTTNHIWLHWIKATGTPDGQAQLYLATTPTRPAPTLSITTGDGADPVTQLRIGTDGGLGIIVDKIRLDDVEIGSNPP